VTWHYQGDPTGGQGPRRFQLGKMKITPGSKAPPDKTAAIGREGGRRAREVRSRRRVAWAGKCTKENKKTLLSKSKQRGSTGKLGGLSKLKVKNVGFCREVATKRENRNEVGTGEGWRYRMRTSVVPGGKHQEGAPVFQVAKRGTGWGGSGHEVTPEKKMRGGGGNREINRKNRPDRKKRGGCPNKKAYQGGGKT